jgi:spore coat protein U-like protein
MKMGMGKLGCIAGLTLLSGAAQAATATSTFTVQLAITAECKINSTNTLDFGTSGVIQANIDTSANLVVQCTNTTPYNIGLDAGTGGGTTTTRKMAGGTSEVINYTLWQVAAGNTNWGNTVATDTKGGTGNGAAQTHVIYGRVAPQTTPSPSSYADTVTVTVTY